MNIKDLQAMSKDERRKILDGKTMQSQELHTPCDHLKFCAYCGPERDALKERVKELEEALAQLHDAYGKDSKAKAAALVKARTLLAKGHLTST